MGVRCDECMSCVEASCSWWMGMHLTTAVVRRRTPRELSFELSMRSGSNCRPDGEAWWDQLQPPAAGSPWTPTCWPPRPGPDHPLYPPYSGKWSRSRQSSTWLQITIANNKYNCDHSGTLRQSVDAMCASDSPKAERTHLWRHRFRRRIICILTRNYSSL